MSFGKYETHVEFLSAVESHLEVVGTGQPVILWPFITSLGGGAVESVISLLVERNTVAALDQGQIQHRKYTTTGQPFLNDAERKELKRVLSERAAAFVPRG